MADLSTTDIIISPSSESVSSTPCQICRRQFSKYTCPRCNIPYCSLTCFRSADHDQCSEVFYRKEVQEDIKTAPSSSAQEKRQMMELLKAFEESSLEDGEEDMSNNEISERLANVDVDAVSTDDLWEMLSEEQRKKFLKALQTPSSELAQQLLASERLQREMRQPWWDDKNMDSESQMRPKLMPIPVSLMKTPPVSGPLLVYNICALFIAYAHTTRHFATSPLSMAPDDEIDAMQEMISHLVPFLTERKSSSLHSNISSVISDIGSRLGPDNLTSRLLSVVLHDVSSLMRPRSVTEITLAAVDNSQDSSIVPNSHPCLTALLALSDIVGLFQDMKSSKHICHKLTFYAAHLVSIPLPVIGALADLLLERSMSIET